MSEHNWIESNVPDEILDSTLFKFKITLPNGNVVDVDMTKDIDIDYEILEQQCEDIPAQYTFWAAIYSELRLASAIYERRVKSRRGVLTDIAIREASDAKVKITDAQMKVIIETDEVLNKLEMQLALSQSKTGKVYHMVEAIKMKCDLIRTLAGFKRQDKDQK